MVFVFCVFLAGKSFIVNRCINKTNLLVLFLHTQFDLLQFVTIIKSSVKSSKDKGIYISRLDLKQK